MTKGYQGATLLQRLGTSLYRILSTIALACLIGIPLGVLMGVSESSRALLNLLTRAHVVDMGIRRFCTARRTSSATIATAGPHELLVALKRCTSIRMRFAR
jgi:ABC-type antimicrobial peptide transport system permease subunit